MSTETKPVMVTLESIPGKKDGKSKKVEFEISRANKILSMKKPAWKLNDANFKWNGTEIAKK